MQNTIESFTFGSEFVAMKIAMEINAALCNKLCMMGVLLKGHPIHLGTTVVLSKMSLSLNQCCTKDTTQLLITSVVRSVLVVQLGWHMSQARRTVVMAL
jgi:hypothetical protein